jgi:hypothetical protein
MVVEEAGAAHDAVFDQPLDAARRDEVLLDAIVRAHGRSQKGGLTERNRRIGQRADDEAVPTGEDLFVAKRLLTLLTRRRKPRLGARQGLLDLGER